MKYNLKINFTHDKYEEKTLVIFYIKRKSPHDEYDTRPFLFIVFKEKASKKKKQCK